MESFSSRLCLNCESQACVAKPAHLRYLAYDLTDYSVVYAVFILQKLRKGHMS